jgi:DNA-binding NarL/FixJ family response regulator
MHDDAQHDASPQMPRRVLVADGDPNVRAALRLLLARQPDFRVVGESHTVDELMRDAAASQPAVILLDWELGDLHAGDHLADLRRVCPAAALIALSTHAEQRQRALAAGATAFVWKGEAPTQLLAALGTSRT